VKRLFRIRLLLQKVEQTLHYNAGDFGGQVNQNDRSIDIVTNDGLTDAGTWRFRRNTFCTGFSAFCARKETCFSIGDLMRAPLRPAMGSA